MAQVNLTITDQPDCDESILISFEMELGKYEDESTSLAVQALQQILDLINSWEDVE